VAFSFSESRNGKDVDSKMSKENSDSEERDQPMFEYNNKALTEIVLDMASNRAKRWMSFRVTNCSKMVGQVGGKSVHKRPLLTLEPNFVLKPVNLDHRGVREVAFYEAIQTSSSKHQRSTYCRLFGPRDLKPLPTHDIFSSWTGRFRNTPERQDCCDESIIDRETKLLHRLELFVPEYYGMVEYVPDESKHDETGPYGTNYNSHLLFLNLTTPFSHPCVLDLKMGTKTYETDAPNEKKDRERSKYPAQDKFGFRMVAMRIYDPHSSKSSSDGYSYFPKSFGRSLDTRDSVKQALRTFFGGTNLSKEVQTNRANAIKRILTQLKLIKGWFKDNDIFEFSASSILLIYEGDTQSTQDVLPDLGTAKMIDFGRVRRKSGGDPGYLKGVRNLISLLEEILRESFWTQEYDYIS
jgi:1D-myo-inositol-tetrakisphosphate 5-kinase/inositol-polyphosphate multikinase